MIMVWHNNFTPVSSLQCISEMHTNVGLHKSFDKLPVDYIMFLDPTRSCEKDHKSTIDPKLSEAQETLRHQHLLDPKLKAQN